MNEDALSSAEAGDLLLEAIDLARAGSALDLRMARVLAALKRMDLTRLGYSSFGAFVTSETEWRSTWVRKLIRLVESPFEQVKAAVASGKLPPTLAAQVVGLDPEEEESWLAAALAGEFRPKRKGEAAVVEASAASETKAADQSSEAGEAGARGSQRAGRPPSGRAIRSPTEEEFTGKQARLIHAARGRARLFLGWEAPDRVADCHILKEWRAGTSTAAMQEAAREVPPAPQPLPPWKWKDPADALIGPWEEPLDPEHGLALLRVVQFARRERIVDLGLLLERIAVERLWQGSWPTIENWVKSALPIDMRTVQRHRRAARAIAEERRFADMDLDRLEFVLDVATEDTMEEWLELAPHIVKRQFPRALEVARTSEEELRARFKAAVAEATKSEHPAPSDEQATKTVRLVALRALLPPAGPPRALRADPELLEASVWYLANARPPTQTGIGKIKLRDEWTCTNPECARRHLRVHVHHEEYRSQGGGDESQNLATECQGCHLRMIHAGKMRVEKHPWGRKYVTHRRELWLFGRP